MRKRTKTKIQLIIVLITLQIAGIGGVELTCGGCLSGENGPEYYCSGITNYRYFRCEGNDSTSLTWDVQPLFEQPYFFGALSRVGNFIKHDANVTIVIDTVKFTDNHWQIISYLWLNLGLLDSDVTVSCINGASKNKTLKLLDSVQPPNSGRAAVYILPTNERLLLCQWSHENPYTVLHYNAKIFINGTLIFTLTVPNGTVNGSSIVSEGKLHLEIEAVGLCGHTATYIIDENTVEYFQDQNNITTENEDKNNGLTTVQAVATTAVVCGVLCFTAGLLLGILLTRCRCRRCRRCQCSSGYGVQKNDQGH